MTDSVENCLLQGLRYYETPRAVIIRSVCRPKIVCVGAGGKTNGERTGRSARDLVSLTYPPRIEGGPGRRVRLNVTTYTLCPMPRRAPVAAPLNPAQGPRSTRFRGDRAEQRRTGRAERASMWTGWSLGTSRTKEPLPCAPMPASGRIRASRAALVDVSGLTPMIAWANGAGCALVGGVVGPPGRTALADLPPPKGRSRSRSAMSP